MVTCDDRNNISPRPAGRANSFAHSDRLAFPVRRLLQDHVSGMESRWHAARALDFRRIFERRIGPARRIVSAHGQRGLDTLDRSHSQDQSAPDWLVTDPRAVHKSRLVGCAVFPKYVLPALH